METNLNGEQTKTNMARVIILIRRFVLKVINNERKINCVGYHTSVQRIRVEIFAGTSGFIRTYGGQVSIYFSSFEFTYVCIVDVWTFI